MKKLLLILLCVPLIGFGQTTMIPDANFEQRLISFGYDNILDGTVLTAAIDTVTSLYVSYYGISDLTGIEDFTALTILNCGANDLTSLDVSNNTALIELNCGLNQLTSLDLSNNTVLTSFWCYNNQLTNLDVRNGNNTNLTYFHTMNNPNLTCINVDNAAWSTSNWTGVGYAFDNHHYFNNNCSGTGIEEHITNKKLIKITDILGREINEKRNTPLFYIYNDGTVEKRMIIE